MLVLRDDPLRVLMVRRNARGTFASALAFPGGSVDDEDAHPQWTRVIDAPERWSEGERALRIAAVREVHEEVGLLIATRPAPHGESVPAVDHPLAEALVARRSVLDLERLVPFGNWVTPETRPRRFDTAFFLVDDSGDDPVVVDGDELVDFRWVRPADLLHRARQRDDIIMFPTLATVALLVDHGTVAEAVASARQTRLAPVMPWIEERGDGATVVRIPSDAGYPLFEHPASERD